MYEAMDYMSYFCIMLFCFWNHQLEMLRSLSYKENMIPNLRCSKVL